MGAKPLPATWRLRPPGTWGRGRLLAAATGLIGLQHQNPRHRIVVDEIFPRNIADALDRHLLQPLRPCFHIRDGHAGGEPPTIVTRPARLAVLSIDELGELGPAGAVELPWRHDAIT